jgi:hypothetical protein
MDARHERGLAVANDQRIKRIAGNAWSVPSASGNGSYIVDVAAGACSCPDHETRRTRCKYLHAVATVIARETETVTNVDGTKAVRETTREVRLTYSQDRPRYNAAQCAEKATAQALLRALWARASASLAISRVPPIGARRPGSVPARPKRRSHTTRFAGSGSLLGCTQGGMVRPRLVRAVTRGFG